jgi:hypothetical protein
MGEEIRRYSVAYATETADGGSKPPQSMVPKQPGIRRLTSTPQGVDMADGGSKPPQPMSSKQPMVAKNATTLAA